MHRKQKISKARILVRRARTAVLKWLTDTERRRHDIYCRSMEQLIAERRRLDGYAF